MKKSNELGEIKQMDKSDMLWIASKWFLKGYSLEDLRYSDDMYGREYFIGDVMDYINELQKIGSDSFYEKYKEFKLY